MKVALTMLTCTNIDKSEVKGTQKQMWRYLNGKIDFCCGNLKSEIFLVVVEKTQ